jgi:ATPase subunit of ABC transporter with duplicated ATPase domains
MLALQSVTKYYGAELVLRDISLSIGKRTRLGIVGPNGIGKSTLLRIAAGLESPDEGKVTCDVRTNIGYLPQEIPSPDRHLEVREFTKKRTGISPVERQQGALLAAIEAAEEQQQILELSGRYTSVLDKWTSLGGADLDSRLLALLDSWDLPEELCSRPVGDLSGGQQARVTLCSIVLARFDIFLLDEPTNNLDFVGLENLEGFCEATRGSLVIVSHDREFLDRTATSILEIQEGTHRGVEYAGGYSEFLEQREQRRRKHHDLYAKYVQEQKRLEESARKLRRWASRGSVARRPDKDKLARGAARDRSTRSDGGASALEKRMAQLAPVEKPWDAWILRLRLEADQRSGDQVVRLVEAVVRRNGFALGPISWELRWQQRIGVIGTNGSGKTSFLELINGSLQPEQGRRQQGSNVYFGYFDQTRRSYETDDPLLRVFVGRAGMPEEDARSQLAKFNLSEDHVVKPARRLSPGERSRAVLAELMARGTNLLLLDEPTNHLDLEAIEELERALQRYDGTLVVVSHDRRFLKNLRLHSLWQTRCGRLEPARLEDVLPASP